MKHRLFVWNTMDRTWYELPSTLSLEMVDYFIKFSRKSKIRTLEVVQ